MKGTILILATAATTLAAVTPATAQERPTVVRFTSASVCCALPRTAPGPVVSEHAFAGAMEDRTRTYAAWGGSAGAVAGGIWGWVLVANADDAIAAPMAFWVTVPVGIVVGALSGAGVAAVTDAPRLRN